MELIPGLPNDIGTECLIRVNFREFHNLSEICKVWKMEIESKLFHQLRKASGLTRVLVVLTQAADNNDSSTATQLSSASPSPPPPAYNLTVYEPETGSWSRLPGIPGHPDGLPLFCQCAGVGRFLVIVGGWNPTTWSASNSVYVYDFVSSVWKQGADVPGPSRSFFGCAVDSNQMLLFIAGGHDDDKNALKSALLYDVLKDKWVLLPDMSNERDECKAIFHAGKFHVIGGYCTEMQGQFENHAEEFEVATWRWCHVGRDLLQTGMCPRNCVVDGEGKLFRCYGGHVSVLEGSTWKDVTKLPEDVCVGPFMLMWQEKIFVIGSKFYGAPRSSYVFESTGNKWAWKKVEMPDGFTGNVQARCTIEV